MVKGSICGWSVDYLGSSDVIPLYDDVYKELAKRPNGLKTHLVKEEGNYKAYRTDDVQMSPPFNGIAYLSVAFLNGRITTYIEA